MAAFSVYSYAKLGAAFPSRGGAAQFLVEGFGDGVLASGLNNFQFLGWVIAMALYASGFAGYALDLLPDTWPSWSGKLIALGLLILVVAVNLVGTRLVGRAEMYVIGVELAILVTFIVLGLTKSHFHHFEASGGSGFLGVLFAAGLLYVTFEGFGVVTNSAGEMRDPAHQLPRAMYGSLAIVTSVYVLVSVVVIATLSLAAIDADQGHVLAEVGQALAGRVGFVAIGAAALLATASGVNATLFGDANLAFQMAEDGELPELFARDLWLGGPGSLFIAAGLTGLFVVAFPLSAVGQMASLAFLIVYGAVSVGHLRIRHRTGAKASLLITAVALNAALFALLLEHAIATGPAATWITLLGTLGFSFAFAAVYRRRRRPRSPSTEASPARGPV